MKRWAVVTLCLAACAQQPATSLDPQTGGAETTPTEALRGVQRLQRAEGHLQRESTGVEAQGQWVGTGLVIKPVTATGTVTMTPSGLNSVSEVRQITVSFDIENALPPSSAAVEFIDPNGLPYQRDEVAIGTSSPQADHISFDLPVAATSIDAHKLTGTWTVRLLVGGEHVLTQNFGLTP
jgi:hypothetical protein